MFLALFLLMGCSERPVLRDDSAQASTPSSDSGFGSPLEEVIGAEYLHLPVLFIDTEGQSIGASEKIDALLEIVRIHDGSHTDLESATRSFSGRIGIEIHGSSSQSYPKQGFRFETRDEQGEDQNESLLGMSDESDWVLHAPYSDKTLLRNALAYELGRQLAEDTGEWQPRSQLCELYMDGSYHGVYLLVERVKRGNDRVDFEPVAATSDEGDITGPYIVKLDQGRNSYWSTAYGNLVSYVYPRYESITSEQASYLQDWFGRFEAMLWGPTWTDEDTGYPAWIRVESFVDHFLLYELSHNIDAYRLSTYFWKEPDDVGGRLHAGPIWDFDRAYGNVDYCSCHTTDGWTHESLDSCGCYGQFAEYWPRLLQDEDFTRELRCRWESLREARLSDEGLRETWLGLVDSVSEAERRDHARWPVIGAYVSPNYYVGDSWQAELDWMFDWLLARAEWMDANLYGSCE